MTSCRASSGVLDNPPADDGKTPPYHLYNIGNNNSENLMDFIGLVEESLGRKATYDFHPMQPRRRQGNLRRYRRHPA